MRENCDGKKTAYDINLYYDYFIGKWCFGFPQEWAAIAILRLFRQEPAIEKPQDMKNATESDQDIVMAQHLIEIDAVQLAV